MGLLTAMFNKGSVTQKGDHTITVDQLLGVDDQAITPTNAGDFGVLRTVPVLKQPRSFTQKEANALEQLAVKRALESRATNQAIGSLKAIKNSDTSEHLAFNDYRTHEARKTLTQVKSNAEAGNAIASLSSKYAALNESVSHRLAVETAKKQAISGMSESFSKLW
jgi:hypothetical protein